MKKIILTELILSNFKGAQNTNILFNADLTEIFGDNGTGKTTVFDSFTWLFFGKDHNENAKFEIKPLDSNNKNSQQIDTEVEGKFLIDGKRNDFKRVYKEKWTKQKGNPEPVFSGNVTSYFHNDVPVTATEYDKKVSEVIDENSFKLITNPLFFNSLPWLKRRAILESVGKIKSDAEIAGENKSFTSLLIEMSGKSFDEYKKFIASAKKVVKQKLDEMPTRIDEASKAIPEKIDFELKRQELAQTKKNLENVLNEIIDGSRTDENTNNLINQKSAELQVEKNIQNAFIANANNEIFNQKTIADNEKNKVVREVQNINFAIESTENAIENKKSVLAICNRELLELREKFNDEAKKTATFDELQLKCPTCSSDFEPWKIEEIKTKHREAFNLAKASKTASMNVTGKNLNSKIKETQEQIDELVLKLSNQKTELEKAKETLENFKDAVIPELATFLLEAKYVDSVDRAEKISSEIKEIREKPTEDKTELLNSLNTKRSELNSRISELQSELQNETVIDTMEKRIVTLKADAKKYGAELTELEGKEFLVEKFVSAKMDEIEKSINGLFPTVKFKLFNHQINGGVSETCETLINGVPFDDANNAAKIQAGIEIINVLSKHNGISAPIFVDNAESIVKLPETESQLIKLVVSENHKKLTVK